MKTVRLDAKRKLVFEITAQDVKDAKRHDKNNCVIACAVASMPGIKGIAVGTKIVQVRTDAGIRRYSTPSYLAKALAKFDATGTWALPAGVYQLNPPAPSLTREAVAAAHRASNDRLRRHINPKTGKRYKLTGRNTRHKRLVNPRVLEFAKIKQAARAAA